MLNPRGAVIFTIKDICNILRSRQLNEYDGNFGVSGRRGDGKSTLILKIMLRFKKQGFKQHKHQVYERSDLMKLLATQKYGFAWDDEAINSGYKRDFQNKGQHELIKLVTNYRDNFNIYASALPFFFSLDRDLRELIFMHIHIIERGLAVVFMQKQDQVHSMDPWDTKNNQRIEEQELKRTQNNPLLKFRYERFSTFAGYLYFTDVTPKQRKKYLEIKHKKRAKRFEEVEGEETKGFFDIVMEQLKAGKLTQVALRQMCLLVNKRLTSVETAINTRLKDEDYPKRIKQLYKKTDDKSEKIEEKPLEMAVPLISI